MSSIKDYREYKRALVGASAHSGVCIREFHPRRSPLDTNDAEVILEPMLRLGNGASS